MLLALSVSLTGMLMYQPLLMSSLLCLEGMVLSTSLTASEMILNTHLTLASSMPMILLVFAACEAALGLSLLVMVSMWHWLCTKYQPLPKLKIISTIMLKPLVQLSKKSLN